jgi:replicative DNA helicase Mcm
MGDIPRIVKIRVVGNHLLDACQPGDNVYVTGVMSVEQRRAKDLVFSWYLALNNIELDTFDVINTELSDAEVEDIENWSLHPDIKDIMINSLFPSIYGHEEEKMGITLALFGGRESERVDITLRGSINVLLIGDPSTAKTAMITAASKLAPKALYTQAGSTTGVGLTAAAIREEDQWVLAAGAVVLANGGTCCIDELEKMNKQDQDQILECMESQRVSVHKANIHTTLTAKTSILAAANPKYGKYDPSATIADNINLSSPLLARFDLIYILRDIPDKFLDEMIAQRIISGYRDEQPDFGVPLMPVDVLKKYIIYAKRIEPTIPAECGRKMIQYYRDLRNAPDRDTDSPLPITARQLQGLSRLSVAMARMHLRDEVTMEDVDTAIGLFMSAFTRVNTDQSGHLDAGMIETGKESKRHAIERIMEETWKVKDLLTKKEAYERVKDKLSHPDFEKGFKYLEQKYGMYQPYGDGRWGRTS